MYQNYSKEHPIITKYLAGWYTKTPILDGHVKGNKETEQGVFIVQKGDYVNLETTIMGEQCNLHSFTQILTKNNWSFYNDNGDRKECLVSGKWIRFISMNKLLKKEFEIIYK